MTERLTQAIQSALAAIRAIEDRHKAENARLRAALVKCLAFIEQFKKDGVELLGEGIHAGLRKGTNARDASTIYQVIADSKTSAWPDAVAFAHDPFFSMWGGDKAIYIARAALNREGVA